MKEFKVGDRVWSIQDGYGKVEKLDRLRYPVLVTHDNGDEVGYTQDGKNYEADEYPSLFHEKPECFKTKVTKEITRWVNIYEYAECLHKSEESANSSVASGLIRCVKLTGTYTVEE